jgi:glycosyltransferase involved in cell wall biosynthesis
MIVANGEQYMQTTVISVIIPIWNREKLIVPCVESILAQTFSDFQLILVDNNSTDRSLEVCREYAAKDQRIEVYENPIQGSASTRNVGIAHARGEYIAFVDSDDTCDPEMLEILHRLMEQYHADYVVGNGSRELGDEVICLDDIRKYVGEYYQKAPFNPPWGRLYRKSLITAMYDPKLKKCEDFMFNLEYIKHIHSVVIYPEDVYLVNTENHFSDTRRYRFDEFSDFAYSQHMLNEFLGTEYLTQDLKNRLYYQSKASILLCIQSQNLDDAQKKEEIHKIINNTELQTSLPEVKLKDWKDHVYYSILKHRNDHMMILLFKTMGGSQE